MSSGIFNVPYGSYSKKENILVFLISFWTHFVTKKLVHLSYLQKEGIFYFINIILQFKKKEAF